VWLGIFAVLMFCCRVVREEEVDRVVLKCTQRGVIWCAWATGSTRRGGWKE